MHKQFYTLRFLFISLMLLFGIAGTCTAQTVQIMAYDLSTGSLGTTASAGDWMDYTITIANNTSSNLTSSIIYGNIPAGTTYVPATTTVNGDAVSDIDGKMPFASGGLINSSSSDPGVLAFNTTAVIKYQVHINTNAGGIKNYATLKAINSSGNTVFVKSDIFTTDSSNSYYSNCPDIYVITSPIPSGNPPTYNYRYIRALNTTNGTSVNLVFSGVSGHIYDALTGAYLTSMNAIRNSAAISYDGFLNRIYYVNNTANTAEDLYYMEPDNQTIGYRYVGYPLETNTNTGYNIDRMTFSPDGYNYALTANAQDLIQFSIDRGTNIPVINRLGPLINDPANGSNDVLSETSGDIFADQAAMLYLIPNSGKMYRINPVTRIATYIGAISNAPTAGINSVASDEAGNIYLGGPYQAVYRVNAGTMNAVLISSGTTGVYTSGDYAGCISTLLAPAINVTKTYTNLSGASSVRAGDPIEYTITISNAGNLSATAVRLLDALPANSHYIANSTTVNGVSVADNGGTMPFAVTSGALINSPGESSGIVKPGDVITIKFRVTTDEYKTICNQSALTYSDGSGNSIYVFSDDPSQPGTTDPTCFYSDKSLISMQANKTYNDLDRSNSIGVVVNDHIEYTIEVTNTGTVDASGVTFYDAIPVHAQYIANSTTINNVAVADIGGAMPYSVTGGSLINSPGASAGVVNPGTTNKAVIKFRVVSTGINVPVCNQATVSFTTASGNTVIYSDDPSQPGNQNPTCFTSFGSVGNRIAVSNTTKNDNSDLQLDQSTFIKVQPNPFIKDLNVQVQLNTAEQVKVRLIDFYGRTVYTTTQHVSAGYNSLHIDVPASLASGIYVLELSSGNNRLVQKKLVKQ